MKNLIKIVVPVFLAFIFMSASIDWQVPNSTKDKKNPYPKQGIEKGKKMFEKNCTACHLADGTGMDAIVKTVDFTTKSFQAQTDGTIHYQIAEGKEGTAMRSYGDDFSDKNIWYIVNYIRTLKK